MDGAGPAGSDDSVERSAGWDGPGARSADDGPGSCGCAPNAPPATVWIVVPFEVATGSSNAACELPGHGWVTAEHARAIITTPGSHWRWLAVDHLTGYAHHNLKTAALWTCAPSAGHDTTRALRWRTLAGRDYITYPKNYAPP